MKKTSADVIVKLYFDVEGRFWFEVDGVKVQLDPWVGVQCEEWIEHPKDWTRGTGFKYVPNDLSNKIKREAAK